LTANIANLKNGRARYTIGEGAVRVHTVEHILSSSECDGSRQRRIEMDANEPPIGDGSAAPYVELIKKAGTVAQEASRRFL